MRSSYTELALLWHWFILPALGLVYIEDQLKNVVVNEGERAKFICKTATHPLDGLKLKLEWRHDGNIVNFTKNDKYVYKRDKNRHSLIIKDARVADAGVYTCKATVDIDIDMSSAHLTVRSAPEPPIEVQVISCHGKSAEIVWQAGPNNGDDITGFIIQYNTSESKDTWHDSDDRSLGDEQTAYVNLNPWGTYSFRVLAMNSVGISKPSKPTKRSCTTPPERPYRNPDNVHTTTEKKGMLVIEWTVIPRLYHNGPGFRYHVYYRPQSQTYWLDGLVTNPAVNYFEVEVNDVYHTYQISVKSENDLGESHQTAFIYKGHSGEDEPTVSPKDFRLDPTHPVGAHTVHFIWEAVDTSEEKIQGHFRGYKLRYWKSSEGRHKMKEVDVVMSARDHGPDVRVALADIPAYTALRAQVAVMNTHYTGPPSQTIDFFTPEGVPGPVRSLHAEAFGMSYVLLKWLPPDEPNGILLGYDIGYQPIMTNNTLGPVKSLKPQITNPSTLGARITGLDPDHEYRFYVWPRTDSGRGDSMYLDIKTADGKLPVVPKPLLSAVHPASANFSWATAHSLHKKDLHLTLQYRRYGDNTWKSTDSEWRKPWTMINNLAPGSKYEVRVVARNRLGDTASSESLLVKTQWPEGQNFYRATDGASCLHSTSSAALLCFVLLITQVFQR
ncbi:neuroglian-like isoform X1 [Haliotis asinina]|uniref:neuroglian-like isoform X1 n=1 Tax=Haliotis asinina TaxID=109174 RepID=UPI0035327209